MAVCASVPGFRHPGVAMYLGKTLFAQAMDFLPWKTFHRIVNRYSGDHRTRSLSCAEQFRVMAFAQLTYRESLRDIEVCLAAQAGKLYHMGISAAVARSTLADANEFARLAHLLRVGSTADHQGSRALRRRGLRRRTGQYRVCPSSSDSITTICPSLTAKPPLSKRYLFRRCRSACWSRLPRRHYTRVYSEKVALSPMAVSAPANF